MRGNVKLILFCVIVSNSKSTNFCTIDGGFDIFLMRFPFEKKLDIDTLSPTKFRNSLNEKLSLISDIRYDSDSSENDIEEIQNKVYAGTLEG